MEITGILIRKKNNNRGKLSITIKDHFNNSKRIQVRSKTVNKVAELNDKDEVKATYFKENGHTILTSITKING